MTNIGVMINVDSGCTSMTLCKPAFLLNNKANLCTDPMINTHRFTRSECYKQWFDIGIGLPWYLDCCSQKLSITYCWLENTEVFENLNIFGQLFELALYQLTKKVIPTEKFSLGIIDLSLWSLVLTRRGFRIKS